jgi:hypothetical protein
LDEKSLFPSFEEASKLSKCHKLVLAAFLGNCSSHKLTALNIPRNVKKQECDEWDEEGDLRDEEGDLPKNQPSYELGLGNI